MPQRLDPPRQIRPGLYRFADTCNVYLLCDQHESIAVDFGSGRWLAQAHALRLPPLRHVFLTHSHDDQCAGLARNRPRNIVVHAPAGAQPLIEPAQVRTLLRQRGGASWFPQTYHPLQRGLSRVRFDMAGFSDLEWAGRRLRFLHTPGHTTEAVSIVIDHAGEQIVFCGDAAHHGATIHQPYNLEWDHWKPTGALAALEGVHRLAGIAVDLLLPSHGPVVDQRPRAMLAQLARRLTAFADSKRSICPGEPDRYLTPMRTLHCGAKQLLPHLYWFANGGYLLLSDTGEALITDPGACLAPLETLLDELGNPPVTAQAVTHFHADHCEGAPDVRRRLHAPLYLHPRVAEQLARGGAFDVPYLHRKSIRPDFLWPRTGSWRWHEYDFRVAPFPGQTWWHCCFMTRIDNRRVLFAGDSFQPASRWNGTGGYCAINGSRMRDGFIPSARLVLDWKPHLLVNGHRTWMHFHPAYFRKVIAWAEKTHHAIQALCPTGDPERDYHLHHPA